MEGSNERLKFTGTGLDILGFYLGQLVLIVCTLGIWIFFALKAFKQWKLRHTQVEGVPLRYRGSFVDAIVSRIKDLIFMAITFGFGLPWLIAGNKAYDLEHTLREDGRRLGFVGTGGQVIGLTLITVFAVPLTLGFAIPWLYILWKRWEWRNTRISVQAADPNARGSLSFEQVKDGGWQSFDFHGTATSLLGLYLVNMILSALTFGIYGAWATVALFRWETENVELVQATNR